MSKKQDAIVVDLSRGAAKTIALGTEATTLKDTLLALLNIQSFPGEEGPVRDYLIPQLEALGVTVQVDEAGNVYGVRGNARKYPLLNAHMDSVRGYSYCSYGGYNTYSWRAEPKEHTCANCFWFWDCTDTFPEKTKAALLAKHPELGKKTQCQKWLALSSYLHDNRSAYGDAEEEPKGPVCTYNEYSAELIGNGSRPIGGDDKCGIAIALRVLANTDRPVKVLFTVREEVGCIGVGEFISKHRDWFKDVKYSLTIDRREGNHLLQTSGGVKLCSDKFAARLAYYAVLNGIKVRMEHGSMSDANSLCNVVPEAVNVSAGYYNPHTCTERVKLYDAFCILGWMRDVIRHV